MRRSIFDVHVPCNARLTCVQMLCMPGATCHMIARQPSARGTGMSCDSALLPVDRNTRPALRMNLLPETHQPDASCSSKHFRNN